MTQLGVLLWRHARVRRRRWLLSALELLGALVPLALLLALWQRLAELRRPSTPFHSQSLSVSQLWIDSPPRALLWAPSPSPFYEDIMKRTTRKLHLRDDSLEGFESEEELLHKKRKTLEMDSTILAVIFQNASGAEEPTRLAYSVRSSQAHDTSRTSPALIFPGPHEQYARTYEGFVAVQMALDLSFIEKRLGKEVNTTLSLRQFPYPAYEHDELFWIKFSILLPLAAVLGALLLLLVSVGRLVSEKASGIKELMKMMGVSSNLLWASHFINCLSPQLLAMAVQICLLKLGPAPLVAASDALVLMISLFLYINYVIFFAFAFSTIFSRPLVACVMASVVWVVTLIVAMIPGLTHSALVALALSFLPNMPIFWMYQLIGVQEMDGTGMTWSRLSNQPSESVLSLALLWLLTVVHCLLYGLVAWYTEQVHPGPYGVPRSPAFLFSRAYWWPQRVSPGSLRVEGDPEVEGDQDPAYFESLIQNAEVGISIRNLWKVYGGWGQVRKVALAGVNMQVLRGGITVLLGHNGAGKTTLMSIITGMYPATRGTVTLEGQAQGQAPHRSVGLCPQHNLTFPHLTLEEHLIFFGMIKGLDYKSAVKEGAEVLERLQLDSKADWLCGSLSGGQRRRAQLAMALVGRPSLLVLDEPTTGLDPHSRRQLWDTLLEIREKHTILITTHFMEEADVLGDRVAILDHGQLCCYGTPMFLKKAFGTGYTLSVVMGAAGQERGEPAAQEVQRLVEAHVRAERLAGAGEEAVLRWRLQPGPAPALPALFRSLECQRDTLCISGMGLALTTLEEVFLKVTEGITEDRGSLRNGVTEETDIGDCRQYLDGAPLLLSRLRALITKKLLYYNSIKISLLVQILLACGMFLLPLLPEKQDEGRRPRGVTPPLSLAPPPYPAPLRLPYSTNMTAAPTQLSRLADMFHMTLEHTQRDMYEAILEEGQKNPERGYTASLLLALSFGPETWNALYSTSVYHGLPSASAMLSNLLALELLPLSAPFPSLVPSCHPLPPSGSLGQRDTHGGKSYTAVVYWACCLTIGSFLLVAIFLPYTILERVTWSGGLVGVGGASPLVRWISLLLPDLVLVCLPVSAALVVATCTLDPDRTFTLASTAGPLLSLLWLYLLASLSFVYCLGLCMKQPAGGYITFLIITIFPGLLMAVSVFVNTQLELGGEGGWAPLLGGAGSLLVPPYALCHGLLSLGFVARENSHCLTRAIRLNQTDRPCCGKDEVTGECIGLLDYFTNADYGISSHIAYMCASAAFYTMVLMLYEFGIWQRLWESLVTLGFEYPELAYFDADVVTEKKAVQNEIDSGVKGESRLLLHRLAKQYRKGLLRSGHVAVKEISIRVKKGECFGLLGANGAGKSTTFGMVVGAQVPTRGTVYHRELGYCPQFDALDGYLTGRQVLSLFCLLRGEPRPLVGPRVEAMLRSAGLEEYADVANRKYSGGNRRKLSALVALGGGGRGWSPVVLLDEPSAGVDPRSRLALHALVHAARSRGRSIVLSSHSMEECEKLVSRLGILSAGELTCLGPVQTLKERYGSGFLLSLRLRAHPVPRSHDTVDSTTDLIPLTRMDSAENLVDRLKSSVHDAFPCQLKDQHLTILQYHISDKECHYSELFSRMEEIRERNTDILEDYTISNTTLEQVFLSLSNGHTPAQA